MENIQAFPLQWPLGWKRTARPQRSQFKRDKTIASAVDEILQQLSRMRASKIIISTNIPVKKDGLPYSSYKTPEDKGAAVYFNLKEVPHVLACDKWDCLEHNLWAIAKHIESLRAQDRWGVGSIEQAFAGFKALPETAGQDAGIKWWNVLGFHYPELITEDDILSAYKALAKLYHPDQPGGSTKKMQELNQAKEEGLKSINL